jgi:hypothetical protein
VCFQGIGGLTMYIFKGMKFNFLLHCNIHELMRVSYFFTREKSTLLCSYMCYNKKLYHTAELCRTHNSLLPVPERYWESNIILFIHFNQITLHPCLNVTQNQTEFLSAKIRHHSSSFWQICITGAQNSFFPVWKLLHNLEEDNILSSTLYKAWPSLSCHCCFCHYHC